MNERKKTLIQLVSFGIVCFLLGVTFVYAQVSQTHVISGGLYPGAPNYTVWTDGATYYAKNSYGVLSYSGANAADVINSAIAACTWGAPDFGGLVELSAQIFYIDKSINLTDGVSLAGKGSDTTYLYAVTPTFPDDTIMINVGDHHRVSIKDMRLYSDAAGVTGIYLGDDTGAQTYQNIISNVFLWGMAIGIDTGEGALNTGCYDSTFIDVRTEGITETGIVLVGSGMTLVNPRLSCSATGNAMKLTKAVGYAIGAAGIVVGGVFGGGE